MRNLMICGAVLIAATAFAKEAKRPAVKAAEKSASGTVETKSGSKASGAAKFTESNGKVTLKLDVANLTPGDHAVHLHEKGDCSDPEAKAAGGHWNPTPAAPNDSHGKWGTEHFHLGDVGNMPVSADGKGTITLQTDKWTIGSGATNDVVGHALVIHGGVDDFKTQPTGNAGNRVGCAVIK